MLQEVYKVLLIFCWSIMLFMGCYLIFGRIVDSLASSVYARARRMIGVGFLIFGLEFVVFTIFNLRLTSPVIAIATNLSVLSVVGNIFAAAVFYMLGDLHYVTRRRAATTFLQVFVFIATIWGTVLSGNSFAIRVVMIGALFFFLFRVYFWIVSFMKVYDRLNSAADNTYSEGLDVTIDWLPKSLLFVVTLCYMCGVSIFAPLWGIVLYMVYAIFVFYFIFTGLVNMMLSSSVVNHLNEFCSRVYDDEVEPITEQAQGVSADLRPDLVEYIAHRLEVWLESESYLKSDITIRSLSAEMNTNRTYLSNYINAIYHCTFRDWITSLRIAAAKQILEEDLGVTITELSSKVGFTSLTSFSRAFARVEGVTPNRWREMNLQQKE